MSQDNGYTPDEFIEFFMSCQDSGIKGFHALEDMPEEWLTKAPEESTEGWMMKASEESLSDALEKLTCTISTDKNGFRIYTLWAD